MNLRLPPEMHHSREHPKTRIGDVFGSKRVTALLEYDHTSNERVEWTCTLCGAWGKSYVFNLRRSKERCLRCPKHS